VAKWYEEATAALRRDREQVDAHVAELREAARMAEEWADDLSGQVELVARLEALQDVVRGRRDPEQTQVIRQALLGAFKRIYLEPTEREGEFLVLPVLRSEMILRDGGVKRLSLRSGEVESCVQIPRKVPIPATVKNGRGPKRSTSVGARSSRCSTSCRSRRRGARSSGH
jgi:hypothetical protein